MTVGGMSSKSAPLQWKLVRESEGHLAVPLQDLWQRLQAEMGGPSIEEAFQPYCVDMPPMYTADLFWTT